MSSEELINAYIEGRISRRTLIRRLVLGGVSLGAAVSYAHLLWPERVSAHPEGCHHPGPPLAIRIVEEDLNIVIDKKRLKVRVTTDHELNVALTARLIRPEHPSYPFSVVGFASLAAPAAGTFPAKIPLMANPPYSVKAVRQERRKFGNAEFHAEVDHCNYSDATDTAVLVAS
jgi:hypothetical protein